MCFLLGNSLASEFYVVTFWNCLYHLHRQGGMILHTYLPMKMEQTECSETSAYKIQMPGIYPEESIQHSEHGESLKSRIMVHSLAGENILIFSKNIQASSGALLSLVFGGNHGLFSHR